MSSTYSNLKIQLMGTGDNSTTWGNVTNVNLGTAMEEAITGSVDVAFSSADVTLTLTNVNTTQSARNVRLNLTGTATAGFNLILGSGCQINKPYIINNATDGTITVKNTSGTGIAVPTGKTMWVFNNGTNVVDAVTHLTSLTLSTFLPVASGGTGGNTAAAARTALGVAASGANTDITALDQDVTITATGTIAADTIGFRGLPQNSQSGAYTLALSDAGKHISITTGGVIIPANSSVAFPTGTVVIIFNNSGSLQNISITTDTLRLAGTSTTGTRVLDQYGLATCVKVASTTWAISGAGLT
jgi:hypothetical protein